MRIIVLAVLFLISSPSLPPKLWGEELPYLYILAEVTKTIDHLYYDPTRINYAVMFGDALTHVQRALPSETFEIVKTAQTLTIRIPQQTYSAEFALPDNRHDFLETLHTLYTLLAQKVSLPFPLKKLEYLMIEGMMRSLDRHSSFLSPAEFQELREDNRGSFSGIGIRVGIKNGQLTILETIQNTPAAQVGLQSGDQILKVNGIATEGWTLPEAVSRIRGSQGTMVTLTITRHSFREPQDFTITRGTITFQTVSSTMLKSGIGHIHVRSFHYQTAEELESALERLQQEELRGLILDLRDNPGGLLNQSVNVAEQFLGENVLIVYTEGRGKKHNLRFVSKRMGRFRSLPLVLLINSSSASASEIVAGALLDLQRAVALGTRTFGKGSVQTILPLHDGSGLRLTTAKYFTPNGKTVDHIGINPDYEIRNAEGDDTQLAMATQILQETFALLAKRSHTLPPDHDTYQLLRQIVYLAREHPLPRNGLHQRNGSPLPDLRYSYRIIDTNGNGILDAGEQDVLHLTVQNTGNVPAKNVRALLLSDSPLFPFQKPFLGDMLQGESKSVQLPLSIPLDVQDSRLTIIVKIGEEGGYTTPPDLLELLVKSR
jgi:carboxyl-terminal processing protease